MSNPVEDLCITLICCGHHLQSNADIALAYHRKVLTDLDMWQARAEKAEAELLDLRERYAHVNAEYEAMMAERDRLTQMVEEMQELIRQSAGVDGLHLNGDIALWDTLMLGGYLEEWLPSWALEDKPHP
jgi:hypothetical protein